MEIRAGTSGYSYKEWKGIFYPAKIAPSEMLAYYAERLSAVEINNTFYRMPKREVVETWARSAPGSFRFAVKVSQRITHRKRLADVEEEMDYLVDQLSPLGTRLGPLLVQLHPTCPPTSGASSASSNTSPDARSSAFEFRHASWQSEPVLACLRERGAALVASESDEAGGDLRRPPRASATCGCAATNSAAGDLAVWVSRVRGLRLGRGLRVLQARGLGGPALAAEFNALAGRGPA